MRKVLFAAALLAALPLAAGAQSRGPGPGPGAQGGGPGAQGQRQGGPRGDPERMEKRMRLARTLGLAEALDLDPAQALKLGELVGQFDARRLTAHEQLRDARAVLRRAAQGESVPAAEVDQAIQRSLDARAQMQAVDREIVAAVTKDLTPEKKARAVLFLSKFQRRFGGAGMGHPGPGRGMGPGTKAMRGMQGGPGMGPGMGQGPMMRMGPGPDDDWDDDE